MRKTDLDSVLRMSSITAKGMKKILISFGWKERQPPKNQPHFYKVDVLEYIVVDERYGEMTIQKPEKWKKYIKRIKANQ